MQLVENDQGLIQATLEIAARRRNTLLRVKAAIRNREWSEADRLITELVPDDKTGDSFNSSQYGVSGRKR